MLTKSRILFLCIFLSGIWFCFSQENKNDVAASEYDAADKLYNEAEKLSSLTDYNDATELKQETMNRQSLALFRTVIAKTTSDSILFHSYVKAGLLEHYFDSLPAAKQYYLNALQLRTKLPALEDSFFFKPTLFAGSIFYSQNFYDTAISYYKKAEQIIDRYSKPLEEAERLYNRMGVIYYETGNYRLANNYFQKAISLLSPSNPSYQDLLINYQMNIASISINLEEYEKAATIFKSILPYKIHLSEIDHNLGIINIRLKKYDEALSYFRKVDYNNTKAVDLYSNMAEAFANTSQKDSAAVYIDKAMTANTQLNGNRKNVSMGLLWKLMADEKDSVNDLTASLSLYQRAICQFYPSYNDSNIYENPASFSGVFSYIQLFNTLIAKAAVFGKLYEQTKNLQQLEASFNAYRSAFMLADHVARSYDSDEARLFLNKIKYAAHDLAIHNSLSLYELTKKQNYLEEAYLLDQENKASALTISLQENSIEKQAGIPEGGLSKQAMLRSEITRASLQASRSTDSATLSKLNEQITENEIRLAKLQEQVSNDPKYAGLQPSVNIPSTATLQDMLDDKTTLLSYHFSDSILVVFIINKSNVDYISQPIDTNFLQQVRSFINSLHSVDAAQRYDGTTAAISLYNLLIKPILQKITNSTRLVIIPDDELNYIAFEALQDEQKKYLLQSFSIQYQFSTALLQLKEIKTGDRSGTLAFAPFTDDLTDDHFQKLPYSKNEVAGLKGKILTGSEATKEQFISNANKYQTLQLATHAVANDSVPGHSFIAFYPSQKKNADDHILYAQEIYNLRLDSTKLVILSACETGIGQLVKGEGLMSISRAFAYAGCPNIITSLWQASDKTTAFITKQLHFYLDKGDNRDLALQQAKLDLLNSNEISPSLKTPNYWAQLVLIGNYEPAKKSFPWYLLAGVFILLSFIYLLVKKMSRNSTGQ